MPAPPECKCCALFCQNSSMPTEIATPSLQSTSAVLTCRRCTSDLPSVSAVLDAAQKMLMSTKTAHPKPLCSIVHRKRRRHKSCAPRPPECERCAQFCAEVVDINEDCAPQASRLRALCSFAQKTSTSTKIAHPRPPERERYAQLHFFLHCAPQAPKASQ